MEAGCGKSVMIGSNCGKLRRSTCLGCDELRPWFENRNFFDHRNHHAINCISQGDRKDRCQKIYVELQVTLCVQAVNYHGTTLAIVGSDKIKRQAPCGYYFVREVAAGFFPAEGGATARVLLRYMDVSGF